MRNGEMIGQTWRAAALQDRDIWLPDYDIEVVSEFGQEWPTAILVTKWERNYLGERRLVGTKMYPAPLDNP